MLDFAETQRLPRASVVPKKQKKKTQTTSGNTEGYNPPIGDSIIPGKIKIF